MKRQSLLSIVPSWFKWALAIVFVCLVAVVVYAANVYQDIQGNKREGFVKSEERVLSETKIVEVDKVSRFHGQKYYHVVSGRTKTDEQMLAYVHQSNAEKKIVSFSLKDFVDKEQIESKWQSECGNCRLLQSNYGIRDNIPLLELSYFDHDDRLSYRYYRLDNGEFESGVSFSNNYKQ
ncbi:DUF5590 domain-containing protein [Paraliobacillus sp. JSM ZJ581]|uniref:cell wall elongation regulator TseB-like domain-containing protein n=1 Tax=Paraliobacillus sp. JSM ZJ581 TaxID=3342118 RepID=UPI0035A85212